MDGQTSPQPEEASLADDAVKKRTPIKDHFQIGWGERAISSAILITIPFTGVTENIKGIIEKATPFIAGMGVITISLLIVFLKDSINEKSKCRQKQKSKEAFDEANKSLESMLSSEHIDAKTKEDVISKINALYSRRALKLEHESMQTEEPEIYSTITNTLTEIENNIMKK